MRRSLQLICCLNLLLMCAVCRAADDPQPSADTPPEQLSAEDVAKLQKKAESGDVPSMLLVGEHYRYGTPPDFEKALNWFRKAAAAGNSSAMDQIGGMYREGFGVEQDYAAAMDWYHKAADAGNLTAIASIGWMHYHGLGVKRDLDEAVRWYRRAAEKGGHEGMNNLGHMYQYGLGVEKDIQQAIHWFQKSAAAGNPYGYDNLGDIYLEGDGVPQDIETAKEMFRKAADLGFEDSMIRLGQLEREKGTPQGQKAALEWFMKAKIHPEAMKEIGECYFDGVGVEPDAEKALEWYQRAMDAGHPAAVVDLADRYLDGRGIKADPEKAMKLLETAAAQKNSRAEFKLAQIAADAKDFKKAFQHYRNAAELGEPLAMVLVAISYHDGRGVPKDETKAINWLKKAADQGSDIARQILSNLDR